MLGPTKSTSAAGAPRLIRTMLDMNAIWLGLTVRAHPKKAGGAARMPHAEAAQTPGVETISKGATRSCTACGKEFRLRRPWQKQCNNVCRQAAYEKRRRDKRPAPLVKVTAVSKAPTEQKVVSPSVPPAYNSQLRPCVLNPDHANYFAQWIPATRSLPGNWGACDACREEWAVVLRREHHLLNLLLPGEPSWTLRSC